MKKLTHILLATALVMGLAACSSKPAHHSMSSGHVAHHASHGKLGKLGSY